jgi:predicted aminopeptidase
MLWILSDASLWVYLLRQAKGQLHIIYHTQKVESVLERRNLDTPQQHKIKLIQEVKAYAEAQFGLKKTANYTTFYDQQNKPILWMLTACEPFSFKEKVWYFPILGEVSYKGFFDYNLAQIEAMELKMQKYDVDIGKVSAWSTLGFLSDPILSSMLENDEGELAELIIHELTHATLYFPNSVDFNENFASFVGQQGAIQFIEDKFGKESIQMKNYLKSIKQENTLKLFLLKQKVLLEAYYQTFRKALSNQEKASLKQNKMNEIINQLYFLEGYNWKTKIKIAHKIKVSGNAYFMSFNRYDAQYDKLLTMYHQQNSNLKEFIIYAKQNLGKGQVNQ